MESLPHTSSTRSPSRPMVLKFLRGSRRRRRLRARLVVAVPVIGIKPGVRRHARRRNHLDANGSPGAGMPVVGGDIADRVLLAKVRGSPLYRRARLIDRIGEECPPSARLSDPN